MADVDSVAKRAEAAALGAPGRKPRCMATRRRRPLVGLQPGICWRPCVPPCPKARFYSVEGGIATAGDARRANAWGADSVVVGTAITGLISSGRLQSRRWQVERVAHIHSRAFCPCRHARRMPIPPIPPGGEGGPQCRPLSAITTSVGDQQSPAIETASCRSQPHHLGASRSQRAIGSSFRL